MTDVSKHAAAIYMEAPKSCRVLKVRVHMPSVNIQPNPSSCCASFGDILSCACLRREGDQLTAPTTSRERW